MPSVIRESLTKPPHELTKQGLGAKVAFCFPCRKVASCTNQMGQISIVAMQNSSPKVTECFNVESRILCMAYVPAEPSHENGEKTTENDHAAATKAGETPSVCLGMEDGRYTTIPVKSSFTGKNDK